jgi:hypothetical protein
MSDQPRRKIRARTWIAVGLLAVLALVVAARRDRVYQPGQTIRYDDFFFTLRGANRSPVPAADAQDRSAPAVEYVVMLTIENRAGRVPFSFPKGAVALFDPRDGRRFFVDPQAQRAYEEATGRTSPEPLVLEAGETARRTYVFRLPADVAGPRLRVAPGGWSGLILENLFSGIQEFRLP